MNFAVLMQERSTSLWECDLRFDAIVVVARLTPWHWGFVAGETNSCSQNMGNANLLDLRKMFSVIFWFKFFLNLLMLYGIFTQQ